MPPIPCKATVSRIDNLTHDVRDIAFEISEPSDFVFQAGQYMAFRVPAPDKPKGASRLYSICSAPSDAPTLRVVYNYVGGPGTHFLHGLHVGDAVDFKAPFGKFVLKADSDRDILYVATGTGIGPFRGMLREHLPQTTHRKTTLLWSVREERDLYYQEEFRALEKSHPNFRLLMTVTRSGATWQGLRGRVTAIFPEYFPSVENLEVYVCGNDDMIKEMKALCDAKGECPFYREIYY
jgi:CDP-4-dehydro-6-deoxyglucose reductase, E3